MTFARKTQSKYGAQIPSGQKKAGAKSAAQAADTPAEQANKANKATKGPQAGTAKKA